MRTEIIPADQPGAIHRSFSFIQSGEIVAFPTDTVYGVGTQAFNPRSIQKLFEVKERDASRAIPILLGAVNQLNTVAETMGYMALRLAGAFWPGPLTLVVQRHPSLPDIIAPDDTIGVRMPDHPVALALLKLSGPLAVTSANLSGRQSSRTAQEVNAQLGGRISLILDGGRTPGGMPSTVVDCTGEKPLILRPGPILMSDLLGALDLGS